MAMPAAFSISIFFGEQGTWLDPAVHQFSRLPVLSAKKEKQGSQENVMGHNWYNGSYFWSDPFTCCDISIPDI